MAVIVDLFCASLMSLFVVFLFISVYLAAVSSETMQYEALFDSWSMQNVVH